MNREIKSWLKVLKLNESTISMLLGALVVIVVGVLIFNYFSKGGQPPFAPTGEISEEITIEEAEFTPVGRKALPAKHEVKQGEHLWAIALEYYQDGYQWPKIAEANSLSNPNIITPGQKLTIPVVEGLEPITSEKYTVKKGDSLWKIALRAYGDPYQWPKIAEANELANPNLIHPENELVIPR